jgi:hypothetical protein
VEVVNSAHGLRTAYDTAGVVLTPNAPHPSTFSPMADDSGLTTYRVTVGLYKLNAVDP